MAVYNRKKLSVTVFGLFFMLLAAWPLSLSAQPLSVRGKVLDRDGKALAGVVVFIQGTRFSSTTDANGYYILEIPDKNVKVDFSCLGFKPQSLEVPPSLTLNVFMDEDTLEMEEAVVVGMGRQRRVSVIGAISSIDKGQMQIPQRNLTNALAGKVAGTVVVQRTGEPGVDNAEFWIRGISSLNSSKPLVLVDGVERDMSDLAIEEIETISVLKDAAATAVYGVRAANGVVIVTTRRGIAQKPVIEVKVEGGLSNLTNMPKLIDGANYMRLANEAAGYAMFSDEQIAMTDSRSDPYMYPNVDWFDTIFTKYSSNAQASISVRGGGERARYYVTIAYINDNGNLKNNPDTPYSSNIHISRYNFRSNVDMTITKTTTLSLEIGANMTDAHQPAPITSTTSFAAVSRELFSECYAQDPVSTPVRVPLGYDESGVMQWGWGAGLTAGNANPAERLFASGYNKTYKSQIMSQILLKQDLSMLTPGLSFTASFSYDANTTNVQSRRRYASRYAINGIDDNGNYILSQTLVGDEFLGYSYVFDGDRADELKAQFNYDRVFADKHRVDAMAMYYQRNYITSTASSSIYALPYRKQGIAARVAYSYADRYFAEFNMGYNGSENFEKGHRFGFFPAGALGYVLSNEPWWGIKAINHLKIRGSIGLVGSDVLAGNGRFAYLSTWSDGLGGHRFGPAGTWYGGTGEAQEGVSNLTWEKGLKKDVGLEIKMFGSKLSLDLDYFHERRWDILIQRSSIPAIAGLNSLPYANMGVMTNQGFEGTGELDLHWGELGTRIYGNFSFARNKVIENDEAPKDEWRMRTGHPYGQCFGLIALGLFKDEADIASSPEQKFGEVRPGDVKYLDYNEDGYVDFHDEVAIGYSNIPEINYGFGAQLLWRGFDLGIFFRGQAHVTYYLGGTFFPFSTGVGKNNLFEKALDRWSEANPNPDAFYPRLSATASTNNMQTSTRTIYDGSLLRLSDLEAGYTFKGRMLRKFGCQSIRLYLVGSNLLLFSPWDMWDPETGSSNGSSYPLARKINLGVRMTF